MTIIDLDEPIKIKDADLKIACDKAGIKVDELEFTRKDGGVIFNHLKMGKLKAKHLKLFPKKLLQEGEGKNIHPVELLPLISALAGVPDIVIDELSLIDLTKLSEGMQDFLGQSPETGKDVSGG